MTIAEFSSELDVIYENINKNGAPGLDDYEKSVILSHAQELLVKETLKVDPSATMFPQLITIYESTTPTTTSTFSWGVTFPNVTGLLSVLNEIVIDSVGAAYTVIPLSAEQFDRFQWTPYKYPPRRRAWRINEMQSTTNAVEIFGRPNITLAKYRVRYVKKPEPIILASITPSIDGISTSQTCKLDTGLHRDILKIAVGLAEQYYYDKYGTDGNK